MKMHSIASFLALLVLAAAGAARADGGRAAPISPEVYARRRASVLERLHARRFVLRSGEAAAGDFDQDFRVDSDFYYLSGVDEPGAAIVVGPGGEDALLLPHRDPGAERWTGPQLCVESPRAGELGFRDVRALPADLPRPDAETRAAIAAMRLVKDGDELARLRRACEISVLAHAEAARSMEAGMAEYELDAVLRYVFRREGAERAGYPSIVGSGPNTCVLHYSRNTRTIHSGELVVCDAGAEYGRYTADVTRTYPVGGRFSAGQRRVYETVLKAQEAGIAAVRPGATIHDVHRAAIRVLEEAGLAKYDFHGTSHWLGLDVHDAGDYGAKLAPGMVLTVEPGVYMVDRALGVRIEDDVLVTERGCEVLTRALPRKPDEIEALMRERGIGSAPLRPLGPAPRPVGAF